MNTYETGQVDDSRGESQSTGGDSHVGGQFLCPESGKEERVGGEVASWVGVFGIRRVREFLSGGFCFL